MSFQQGLSGLNAAARSLEVIGNNVANANTVGFKQSQTQFADVFANSLTGAGASQIGIGTKVAAVSQQFTQGNITSTNNPLDLSINGGGFFRMSNEGNVTYGRNGQFQLDKNGYIVNSAGARLTGYMADATGSLATGAPQELNINTADLPARVTENVKTVLNLNSSDSIPPATPFNMQDPATYNNTTSVSIYDTLGNLHVLQSYYVKVAPGTWDVYGAVNGQPINFTPADPGPPATPESHGTIGRLVFDSYGALDAATKASLPFAVPIEVSTGAVTPFTIGMDFAGTTQFGAEFGVNALSQDGYTSGRLSGFNISGDGMILGRYTNGKSNTLGQVVLARFTNPNGLQPLGGNAWAETADSGASLIGTPGSGNLGVLQSSSVEESNVDLTAELVKMITAQRVYQANAQTIKTQDQVMQTLVNLR